jgi:hypothetical protein
MHYSSAADRSGIETCFKEPGMILGHFRPVPEGREMEKMFEMMDEMMDRMCGEERVRMMTRMF